MTIELTKDDLEPAVRVTLESPPGTPINLTDTTVTFSMFLQGSTTPKVNAEDATIIDAKSGVVEYAWQSGDTDTIGGYTARFVVSYAGNRPRTFPSKGKLYININP